MINNEVGTYIKLYRRIANWGWYQEPNTFKAFIHCLICASTKPKEYKGTMLDIGEFVMGYEKFGKECGLSRQQVRTAINHLISTNELTTKSTNQGTIVKVINFGFYQGKDYESNQRVNQQSNQRPTNDQPTTNQRPTTNNNNNKDNNVINTIKEIIKEKKNYGEFQNVLLSDDELAKLKEEFPQDWQLRIEQLSCSMESTGRTYKNHLATIKNWAKHKNNVSKNTGKHSLDDYVAQAKELDERQNQRKNALKKLAEEYS